MGRYKQFIELQGKPALSYPLRAFESAPGVSGIYTVGDEPGISEMVRQMVLKKYAGCAKPGSSRSRSALNGVRLIDEPPETPVLIHDGSRCLVTPSLIQCVIDAFYGADCVIPALPASDTVKVVREGVVAKTLDRSELFSVQTPQAFRLGTLRRVYERHAGSLDSATDDASLVEMEGGTVKVVAGEKTNVKLTSPEDLVLAGAMLAALEEP